MNRLPELGPGQPNLAVRDRLASLTPEQVCPGFLDLEAARACLSGLWLFHDFLDESHAISQELPGWMGSYWHGIMHRREPDADNAAYWFRRVKANPVYDALAALSVSRGSSDGWDPFAFVDRCERERGRGTAAELDCRHIQLREMELLFDFCYRHAMGKPSLTS